MKFNKKCSLALGEEEFHSLIYAEATQLEVIVAEKNLGVLLDARLNVREKCTLVAKNAGGVLSCFRRCIASDKGR